MGSKRYAQIYTDLRSNMYTQLLNGITYASSVRSPSRVQSTRTQPSGAVLFYHGLVTEYIDRGLQKNHITVQEFRRQLSWLKKNRTIVSAQEVRAALKGTHTLPPKWTLLTFDDGYRNNLELVAPELNGLPWLLYLATDMIDQDLRMPSYRIRRAIRAHQKSSLNIPCLKTEFDCSTPQHRALIERGLVAQLKRSPKSLHDQLIKEVEQQVPYDHLNEWDQRFVSEAPLNWAEIRQLVNAGVEIGGHTRSHCLLHPQQPISLIQDEIHQCAHRIQTELGIIPKDFCWPNGQPQDLSLSAIHTLGKSDFEWATTTSSGCTTLNWSERWLTPRVPAGTLESIIHCLLKAQILSRNISRPQH